MEEEEEEEEKEYFDTNLITLKLFEHVVKYKLTEIEQRILFWLVRFLRRKDYMVQIKLSIIKRDIRLKKTTISNFEKYLYSMNKKMKNVVSGDENTILEIFKKFDIVEYHVLSDKIYGKYLNIQKNEKFEDYFYGVPYTVYRTMDYMKMKCIYSIRLHLLLNPYRRIGKKKFEIDKFKNVMGFPDAYRMTNITKYLNIAVEENQNRLVGLKYIKVKEGGKAIKTIIFTWQRRIKPI